MKVFVDTAALREIEELTLTARDYTVVGDLHLVPHHGNKALAAIRVRTICNRAHTLATVPRVRVPKGKPRLLSNSSVAKIVTPLGSVFKYAQRISS